jgi:adenylate cyclase
MRQHGDAQRAFRRALDLNPNFALAHARLAQPLCLQGAYQEAIDSSEHALRLSPRDRLVGSYASLALAQAYFAAGLYSECVTWARSMIAKSPENGRGNVFLVAALAMEGDLPAAAEARGTLLGLQPEFSLAWMKENHPHTGEMAERLREGLRRAGIAET